MKPLRPAFAASLRRAGAKPTASKPSASARARISWRGEVIGSPAPAIGRHILRGNPEALGRRARLEEHVDGHAPARIPIAADTEPARPQARNQGLGNVDGAGFVKGTVIAEG